MKRSFVFNPKFPQRGVSLIIVLILLVVIGLTAASAMRSATSSQMVTNNVRMDNVAQQYAEAALRYCESQLQLSSAVRADNSLRNAVIPLVDMTVVGAVGAWENPLSWTAVPGGGGAASTRTALGANQYSSVSSSYAPARAPECVVERHNMGATPFIATVVTARGFSPDYQSDASGNTSHGAVVWLQSLLNLDPNDLP
jgi:Tfp pilus assembly protein PilX